MKFRLASLACLSAVLLSVAPAAAQTATLRYRWAKGDVVLYRVTMEGRSTMTGVPGMGDMVVDQMVVQGLRLTVDDVAADGTATIRQTFESMRMEVNSPAGTIAFDSAAGGKADDPIGAAVAAPMLAMIGESMTVVMQPTGKVVKLEGMSRIFDKVMARMPENPGAAQMLEQLKMSMGDEGMRAIIQQGFGTFPDRPVKIGESWSDQMKTNHPLLGAITTDATFTLKSIEAGTDASVAHVDVKTAMSYTPTGTPSGPMNVVVKAADATSEGEVIFDTVKGRMQKTTAKVDTPMTLSMQGPDGTAVTIQSVARNTMTMELLDKQ